MKKKTVPAPDLQAWRQLPSGAARNRRLLEWFSDDARRAELYVLVNDDLKGTLAFPSRDSGMRDAIGVDLGTPRPPPNMGHRDVVLFTRRPEIEAVLRDTSRYSNRIYAELGGGGFMLALDPSAGDAHAEQRKAYRACFPDKEGQIRELSHRACEAASIMGLKSAEFDLASFAEQAAVRFCQKLMGYSFRDYPLLERTLRTAYGGLVYQVLGRHFTTDPLAIPAAREALGRLLARTSALIEAYATNDEDALKGCKDDAVPNGMVPVLQKLGSYEAELNGEQLAIIAAGAAVGSVGNVQAAACIAVQAFFANQSLFRQARELALGECSSRETAKFEDWQLLIEDALRQNPPIPFLPRMEVDANGEPVREVLLALGGATRFPEAPRRGDPLIWGLPPRPQATGPASAGAPHWCAGQALAWPLIVEIVRRVMGLPGLAERLDPEDASVIGLKKRWGFACESYPLTHQRERRVAQGSLNVAMRLKAPVHESAVRVREVIRAGAPLIEQALRGARHVHFAWFELIEADTVLVLHTVYDGPFSAYIQHFALKVGDLFDSLFECIEHPPPMPVDKFPNEFAAHIQRYDRGPAAGYFFSAYPRTEVAAIQRFERAGA